jgi:hypothetical protein
MQPGTLYIVATPLGNLGDLSQRAAELLRQVPVVAAEDTRRTRGLLSHLGASPTVLSFHAHSGSHRADSLLEILASGRDVALVLRSRRPAALTRRCRWSEGVASSTSTTTCSAEHSTATYSPAAALGAAVDISTSFR